MLLTIIRMISSDPSKYVWKAHKASDSLKRFLNVHQNHFATYIKNVSLDMKKRLDCVFLF